MNARLAVLLLLLPASGCRTWQYAPWGYPQPPQVLQQASTRDMVISTVNGNAQSVQSLKTTQASLSVSGVPTTLPVDIALERPGRFRMKAEKFLATQLDLGSNDELFWFWARLDPTGRMYYCRHDAFSAGAARGVLPVDPDRMAEAFGLAAFDRNDEIGNPEPVGQGRLRIRSVRQTNRGAETKITVIDDRTAMVLEQHVYDASGRKLVSVLTSDHQQDAASGAWLPRTIAIHGDFQGQPLELSIEIDGLEVNTLSAEDASLWQKPQYPGAQDFDLCGGGAGGAYPSLDTPPLPLGPQTGGFTAPSQPDGAANPNSSSARPAVRFNDPRSSDPESSDSENSEAAGSRATNTAADTNGSRQRFVPWRRPQ